MLRAWISAACRVVFDQDYQILKLSRSSVLVSATSTLRFRRCEDDAGASVRGDVALPGFDDSSVDLPDVLMTCSL